MTNASQLNDETFVLPSSLLNWKSQVDAITLLNLTLAAAGCRSGRRMPTGRAA
jgi:hypothetical protein